MYKIFRFVEVLYTVFYDRLTRLLKYEITESNTLHASSLQLSVYVDLVYRVP